MNMENNNIISFNISNVFSFIILKWYKIVIKNNNINSSKILNKIAFI